MHPLSIHSSAQQICHWGLVQRRSVNGLVLQDLSCAMSCQLPLKCAWAVRLGVFISAGNANLRQTDTAPTLLLLFEPVLLFGLDCILGMGLCLWSDQILAPSPAGAYNLIRKDSGGSDVVFKPHSTSPPPGLDTCGCLSAKCVTTGGMGKSEDSFNFTGGATSTRFMRQITSALLQGRCYSEPLT